MKNKLILILLTVFVVGSIASITAFNSLQEDKADAVGNEIQKKPDPQPLTVSVEQNMDMKNRGYDNFYFVVTDSKGEPVEGVWLKGNGSFYWSFKDKMNSMVNIRLETDEDGVTEERATLDKKDYWTTGEFETVKVPEGYKKFNIKFRVNDELGNPFDPIEITEKRDF
jgi:hypothetical protein